MKSVLMLVATFAFLSVGRQVAKADEDFGWKWDKQSDNIVSTAELPEKARIVVKVDEVPGAPKVWISKVGTGAFLEGFDPKKGDEISYKVKSKGSYEITGRLVASAVKEIKFEKKDGKVLATIINVNGGISYIFRISVIEP